MISQTLSRRYAQALMGIGQEDGNYSQYGEELAAFVKLFEKTELAQALSNPIYPADSRRNVLEAVTARMDFSRIVQNFLGLLQDKGRISHVQGVNEHYQRLVDEVNNIQRATVTAAGPISQALQSQIKATLEKMTGKTIFLEIVQDPEIIGGAVAKVGDLTLDGSLKTQLMNLKELLIKG
ncbi:MAG: ATP synthase F1 subunit delta [Pseudomonadota bacterium]